MEALNSDEQSEIMVGTRLTRASTSEITA